MKNKRSKITNFLKAGTLLLSLSLLLWSCEKNEHLVEKEQNLKVSEIAVSKFLNVTNFTELNKNLIKAKALQKTTSFLDFEIDYSTIRRVRFDEEKNTYTLSINRKGGNTNIFENLVLLEEKGTIIKVLIIEYSLDDYKYDYNHKSFFIKGKRKVRELDVSDFTSNFSQRVECFEVYEVWCSESYPHVASGTCFVGTNLYLKSALECMSLENNVIDPNSGGGNNSFLGGSTVSSNSTITSPIIKVNSDGSIPVLSIGESMANQINSALNFSLSPEEMGWLINNPLESSVIDIFLETNNTPEAESFAQQAIEFLMNNTQFSFDYLLNNRTNIDANQTELDDYVDGGFDNNSYDEFDPQQQPWPNISPIIPAADFIGWGSPGIRRNCMDYAKAQIAKSGYQISSYHSSNQTIQIYTSANGVNNTELKKGLSYLKYALSNDIPVVVGVEDQPGSPNPLTDNTTDHFVVIVGMGSDTSGNYFLFYDNASGNSTQGASSLNKLYYNSTTGLISGTSQTSYANGLTYILTMIRKSKIK